MASSILFQGVVNALPLRVVDRGAAGLPAGTPRLQVEIQQQPDAMGGVGWGAYGQLDMPTFSALMLAAGVIH